jgi:hypothetical protein
MEQELKTVLLSDISTLKALLSKCQNDDLRSRLQLQADAARAALDTALTQLSETAKALNMKLSVDADSSASIHSQLQRHADGLTAQLAQATRVQLTAAHTELNTGISHAEAVTAAVQQLCTTFAAQKGSLETEIQVLQRLLRVGAESAASMESARIIELKTAVKVGRESACVLAVRTYITYTLKPDVTGM